MVVRFRKETDKRKGEDKDREGGRRIRRMNKREDEEDAAAD